MINFLSRFKSLVDLGGFEDKYKVANTDDIIIKLKDLPEQKRIKEIIKYATESGIELSTLAQIAILDERKKTLTIFNELLNTTGYTENYKKENGITKQGEEAVWHFFLKKHEWLLGLNLDIKFIQDFVDEPSVGNPNTENKGNPNPDLMGVSDYTVLVELKTSNTPFFTEKKTSEARAKTWSFTSEFIEGFSQCLSQKSEWDKNSKTKDLIKDKKILNQNIHRTADTKTIYIVGNKKKELPTDSDDVDIIIKRDTLELFRRNNRNIEIISYDELYERANFIVNGIK